MEKRNGPNLDVLKCICRYMLLIKWEREKTTLNDMFLWKNMSAVCSYIDNSCAILQYTYSDFIWQTKSLWLDITFGQKGGLRIKTQKEIFLL